MNKRVEFIVPIIGSGLFAFGLIFSVIGISSSMDIADKRQHLARQLVRMSELEQVLENRQQARQIILSHTRPDTPEQILSRVAASSSHEINLIEQQSLQEGWTLKRYDVMLPEMNLNDLTEVLAALDAHPALCVRNLTLTASPTQPGCARVSMEWQILQPPEKSP